MQEGNFCWLYPDRICNFCHNPGQPKTKSPGVVLISVRKTTTPHHTGDDYNSGSSRQPRNLIFGMQPYSNPTRRKRKTTLKKIMQPKTIKSKNNGCGTALGNLVYYLNLLEESLVRSESSKY